jgi:ABC-type polysaccharide/polyol phosphate export permease
MNQKLKLFLQLLRTDLKIYKSAILNSIIDASIWFTCLIVIFAYVFPISGMSQKFSLLIAVGAIVSCSFWDVWATATTFVADIGGNKTVEYYLTLPLPNVLVFIKQILGYAIKAAPSALMILPLTKLFLWNQFSMANFSIIKFVPIFILINLFTGAFSLFITSQITDMTHLGKVGIRYLFPLWFFGGSNYSWQMVYKLSPTFAYATLLNPLIYAMEGIRVAVLGQQGYMPFYICVLALLLFTILFGFLGIIKLKKRLDFV